jgi:hypothetical protein
MVKIVEYISIPIGHLDDEPPVIEATNPYNPGAGK